MTDQQNKNTWIEHHAGELIVGVQKCIYCGKKLVDHKSIFNYPLPHWPPGKVYERGALWGRHVGPDASIKTCTKR